MQPPENREKESITHSCANLLIAIAVIIFCSSWDNLSAMKERPYNTRRLHNREDELNALCSGDQIKHFASAISADIAEPQHPHLIREIDEFADFKNQRPIPLEFVPQQNALQATLQHDLEQHTPSFLNHRNYGALHEQSRAGNTHYLPIQRMLTTSAAKPASAQSKQRHTSPIAESESDTNDEIKERTARFSPDHPQRIYAAAKPTTKNIVEFIILSLFTFIGSYLLIRPSK